MYYRNYCLFWSKFSIEFDLFSYVSSQVIPLAGYDKHGRKVIIDISSKMDLEVGNLEERQRVAMMVMDMGFHNPDEQVQAIENFNVSLETLKKF